MIELTLPWPPSGNRYWRRAQGRVLISREGREYQRTVKDQLIANRVPVIADESRLSVEIAAFPPDRRNRDLDNLLKALLDAMEKGGLFPDDEQIDDLRISRRGVDKPGRVEISIATMGEEQ